MGYAIQNYFDGFLYVPCSWVYGASTNSRGQVVVRETKVGTSEWYVVVCI